ncbi:MAG: radical SAM protein, partial [Candidatus Omnitrophica bacterium]|nr:radical SAM protein [Candidatus Omnitrophota bacterium]
FVDFDVFDRGHDARALPIVSSRGCIWSCNFCSEKNLYKKFRHHSPAYVTGHIKHLVKKHNVHTFIFCDSLINYSNGWLSEFCELLLKEELAIQWEAQMRVDGAFPLELGRLMKKSGCYNLFVGLESACDKTLRSMQKGFTVKNALDFFITLADAGLQFEISLILGYPGETHQDFEETIEFIKKNKRSIPKIAQANQFVDYNNECGDVSLPAEDAQKKIQRFCAMLAEEKISYTRRYIGNLMYPHCAKGAR